MKEQLNLNENLLSVYFNIMISCKQFNSNKILYLNNNNNNSSSSFSRKSSINDTDSNKRKDSSQDLSIITTPTRKLNHSKVQSNDEFSTKFEYDADEELSVAGKL